jgi:hypothetical protein
MTEYKSRSLSMLLAGILLGSMVHAQDSSNSSGGDATGGGGKVAYSLGQVVYNTNTESSGSISQGVQHSYEIFTVGVKETALNILLTAFPNPTTQNLTLQITDYNNEKLSYLLFDMQGKLLNSEQLTTQQTQINIVSLPSATYFINILNHKNNQIQSFKIIKN